MASVTHHTYRNGHDKKVVLNELHNTGAAFSKATKTARKSARHIGDLALHDLKKQGRMFQKRAVEYAQEKPFMVLGGALLAGAFLALLLKR